MDLVTVAAGMERRSEPVLVVEDDPDEAEQLVTAFESMGFSTLRADNVTNALGVLRSGERPCVILLDVALPAHDGSAFRRAQQADPRPAPIPVIVLSEFADLPHARPLSAHVLVKPVDIDVLKETVREVCG